MKLLVARRQKKGTSITLSSGQTKLSAKNSSSILDTQTSSSREKFSITSARVARQSELFVASDDFCLRPHTVGIVRLDKSNKTGDKGLICFKLICNHFYSICAVIMTIDTKQHYQNAYAMFIRGIVFKLIMACLVSFCPVNIMRMFNRFLRLLVVPKDIPLLFSESEIRL